MTATINIERLWDQKYLDASKPFPVDGVSDAASGGNIDVNPGGVGDAKYVTNGACTSSSKVVTSATAGFSSTDVGKYISVKAAGGGGADLETTIASVQSATQITLTAACSASLSNRTLIWGTDDTATLNAAIQAAYAAGGATIAFAPGKKYLVSGSGLNFNQNMRIRCTGYGATLIPTTGSSAITIKPDVVGSAALNGPFVEGFYIDGANMTAATGIHVISSNGHSLRAMRGHNLDVGVKLTNALLSDGVTQGYCERGRYDDLQFDGGNTGLLFEVTTGTGSFEESCFTHCTFSGNTTGIHTGPNTQMLNVTMFGCKVWAVGSQTCMLNEGSMSGCEFFLNFEALSGTGNVAVQWTNGVDAASQNEAGFWFSLAGSTQWAATRFVFDNGNAATGFTYVRGRYFYMAGTGGYAWRVRGDGESQDRMRASRTNLEWGPGGSTVPDVVFQRNSDVTLSLNHRLEAADGIQTLVVAGAVSDGSFTAAPASGTIAVDSTDSKLYVRVGNVWKSVTLT